MPFLVDGVLSGDAGRGRIGCRDKSCRGCCRPPTRFSCNGVVRRLLTFDGTRLGIAEKGVGALALMKHGSGFTPAPSDTAMPIPEGVGRCSAPAHENPDLRVNTRTGQVSLFFYLNALPRRMPPDVDRSIRGNHAGPTSGLDVEPHSFQGLYKSLRRLLSCWSNISRGKDTCVDR
jgi:hypothetical protein